MTRQEELLMKEAMHTRHTVRRYLDKPIPEEIIRKLNARIAENNRKYNLALKLMVNDDRPFNAILRTILAKGVKNYIILSGKDTPDLDERLGYSGADLMLYAQTLGLNTWWIGVTFSKKATAQVADGEKIIGIIAIGYGATQGVPHRSKRPEEVASYNGEAPEWFKKGVEAALLAPTAINRQAFKITGNGRKVKVVCNNGVFTGADLGIVKYHFELGAGAENFEWTQE